MNVQFINTSQSPSSRFGRFAIFNQKFPNTKPRHQAIYTKQLAYTLNWLWELRIPRTGYIKCKYYGFHFCIGPPEILLYMQRIVSCEVWGSDDCGAEDSHVFWDLTLCRRVHVSPKLVPVYLSLKMEALLSFEASRSVTQRHSGTSRITLIFKSNHFLVDVSWHKWCERDILCRRTTRVPKSRPTYFVRWHVTFVGPQDGT
jgi:hypothetical protein